MALSNKEYSEAIQEARYFSTFDLVGAIQTGENTVSERLDYIIKKISIDMANKENIYKETEFVEQIQDRMSIYKAELIDRINTMSPDSASKIISGQIKLHAEITEPQQKLISKIFNSYEKEGDITKEVENYADAIASGKKEIREDSINIDKNLYLCLYKIAVKTPEKAISLSENMKLLLITGSKVFGMSGDNHRETLKQIQNINNSLVMPSSHDMLKRIKEKITFISKNNPAPPKNKLSTI